MVNLLKRSLKLSCLSLVGAATLALQPSEARAYDMDCKVILCIAGGFPSECRG